MHDAISAEKLGIPAVAVITQRFLPTARAMWTFAGLKDYPVSCVAHPISHNTEAEVRSKAKEIVSHAVAILHSPSRRLTE